MVPQGEVVVNDDLPDSSNISGRDPAKKRQIARQFILFPSGFLVFNVIIARYNCLKMLIWE